MITAQQLARNREHFRAEGRKARAEGIAIAYCPYTPAVPPLPMFGVHQAMEWLNGWREQDELMGEFCQCEHPKAAFRKITAAPHCEACGKALCP